jgi:hypothetical protein
MVTIITYIYGVQKRAFLASYFANYFVRELEDANQKNFKNLLVRNFQLKKIELAK